jgi:5-methylcytosine-specific restriction enzyme subunit McrC
MLIEMEAWSSSGVGSLSQAQIAEVASAGLVDVKVRRDAGEWSLEANSRVGVACGDGWELRVRPRLSVPNLFFLLAYAADPQGWKDQIARFAFEPDLFDAIASGFSLHALSAIERGLLRGYIQVDEELRTIRGRVRFGDQVSRHMTMPLPIEVSYDDYTVDISENQILRSATLALLRLPRIPPLARRRLLKLRCLLEEVSVVPRPREVRLPPETRLNERYQPCLKLAELILHASSVDAASGCIAAAAFVFDMNRVFEDFVTTALGEAMRGYGGKLSAQLRRPLDRNRELSIKPDLTWWDRSRCLAVADAKYKALKPSSMPNADMYQMLTYCTVLNIHRGYLIYARDSGEQERTYEILNNDCLIEVRTLDVESEPDPLLRQVASLAAELHRNRESASAA